jgi:hypothetical protein
MSRNAKSIRQRISKPSVKIASAVFASNAYLEIIVTTMW